MKITKLIRILNSSIIASLALGLLPAVSLAQASTSETTKRVRYISSAPKKVRAKGKNRPTSDKIIRKSEVDESTLRKIEPANIKLERRVFDLVNKERKAKGLKALAWSEIAAKVARNHSEDMARYNFFSHVGLDGLLVDKRASLVGLVDWHSLGENIAYCKGFEKPGEFVVKRWMLSKGHRENILNTRWMEAGIGLAKTSEGTYYFTQVFVLE